MGEKEVFFLIWDGDRVSCVWSRFFGRNFGEGRFFVLWFGSDSRSLGNFLIRTLIMGVYGARTRNRGMRWEILFFFFFWF